MGTTPIYGFPYPDPSDLVANYPAQGQELAEDVESVIAALPAAGLSFVSAGSFSASSGVNVNNVFTSTYSNYFLTVYAAGSTTQDFRMRLRKAGTDDTSSTYKYAYTSIVFGSSPAYGGEGGNNTQQWQWSRLSASQTVRFFEIGQPQVNTRTTISFAGLDLEVYANNGMGFHNTVDQFDGFTIYPSTGTFTGNYRVYGLRDS